MTYEVVGFLTEGQIFIAPGTGDIGTFDKYMIVPYIYKTEEEWLTWIYDSANADYRPQTRGMLGNYYLPSLGHMSFARTFLVDKGNEELAETVINTALEETGLSGCLSCWLSSRIESQAADYFRENSTTLTVLVSVMALFAVVGIVFSAINNTSANMRSYAIQTLNGATRTSNIIYASLETFIYCVLGFISGFCIMYSSLIYFGYENHPALNMMIEKGFAVAVAIAEERTH